MAVGDYDTTAANNTSISGIDISENCSPAGINNAIRQMMADIATGIGDGSFGDLSGYQPLDATLTALAGVSTAADKLIYATASDTFTTATITSAARDLLDDTTAAAMLTTLGAFAVSASSIGSNSGYIKFNNNLMFQWGTGTLSANSTDTVSFPQTYTTWAIPVASGGNSSTTREGDVVPYATGLSSFSIKNSAAGSAATYYWISVGV